MPRSVSAYLEHLVSEFLVSNLSRKANRRLSEKLEKSRPGSFPFISADTFRALADVVIEPGVHYSRPVLNRRPIIYFDLASLDGSELQIEDSETLQTLSNQLDEQQSAPVVILHNGDILPRTPILERIKRQSFHVFASNTLEESRNLTALPVGIENAYRNENGALSDFLRFRDQPPTEPRPLRVFSRFNVGNNPAVREPLATAIEQSRFEWSSERLSPQEYRLRVARSKFVLSPPGNGFDCHRTWEAIYLGAIPVVLSSFTPPSFSQGMPIVSVDSFDNFLRHSDAELDNVFERTHSSVTADKCYMPYWIQLIREVANSGY